MKKYFILILLLGLITSCSVRKNGYQNKVEKTTSMESSFIQKIIKTAESYQGTPYRFSGTTKRGMDCSGLIYQVFLEHHIPFPRVSSQQAKKGTKVSENKVKKGDLLFFATSGGNRISHVGMVHHVKNGEIFFIHASSSKGVMISSLQNKYWSKVFLFAKRVL